MYPSCSKTMDQNSSLYDTLRKREIVPADTATVEPPRSDIVFLNPTLSECCPFAGDNRAAITHLLD